MYVCMAMNHSREIGENVNKPWSDQPTNRPALVNISLDIYIKLDWTVHLHIWVKVAINTVDLFGEIHMSSCKY